jgi:hypothetical protein
MLHIIPGIGGAVSHHIGIGDFRIGGFSTHEVFKILISNVRALRQDKKRFGERNSHGSGLDRISGAVCGKIERVELTRHDAENRVKTSKSRTPNTENARNARAKTDAVQKSTKCGQARCEYGGGRRRLRKKRREVKLKPRMVNEITLFGILIGPMKTQEIAVCFDSIGTTIVTRAQLSRQMNSLES